MNTSKVSGSGLTSPSPVIPLSPAAVVSRSLETSIPHSQVNVEGEQPLPPYSIVPVPDGAASLSALNRIDSLAGHHLPPYSNTPQIHEGVAAASTFQSEGSVAIYSFGSHVGSFPGSEEELLPYHGNQQL